MKRFLLAACLALILHGAFFAFGPDLIKQRSPSMPSHLTMTFSTRETPEAEQGPGPEIQHPVPLQEKASPETETKKEPVVTKPPVPPRPKAEAKPEKQAVRPRPQKETPRPKERITPRPQMETKARTDDAGTSETGPEPVPATLPTMDSQPAQEKGDPVGLAWDLPGLTHQEAPEAGKNTASEPADKEIIRAVPAYRDNPRPEYPRRAKRRGHEGTVVLEVLVNRAGKVEDLRVASSSGYAALDRSAMKSVEKWLFEPGSIGGHKVDMWVRVPVRFELRER